MDIYEILKDCKVRYPIGTKFRCAIGNTDELNTIENQKSINGVFTVLSYDYHSEMGVYGGVNAWLYYDGKYATIVNELNNYYFY